MLSHEKVWAAIDALASQNGLSPSGLARRAGLDPTTFNRSKRIAGDGRLRWPSTESLAKILEATGEELRFFADRMETAGREDTPRQDLVPLAGFNDIDERASFDHSGRPAGMHWETFSYPPVRSKGEFALEVSGDDLLPLYRKGDIIIVAPETAVRRGDRVVAKPKRSTLAVYTLHRRTPAGLEFQTIGDKPELRRFKHSEIDWTARIIWASQ